MKRSRKLPQRPQCLHPGAISLAAILLVVALAAEPAHGDGGVVRLSEVRGPHRVTVFTSPQPLRAGPIDVSVLVQRVDDGELVEQADVDVTLVARDRPALRLHRQATFDQATNKLFRAAKLDLPSAGEWDLRVTVTGTKTPSTHEVTVAADRELPRWQALWPWFSWPLAAVAAFALQQWLARTRPNWREANGREV